MNRISELPLSSLWENEGSKNNVNILLINSPIRLDAKPNCMPYGLATIAAVLRDAGYEVDSYDINALRPSKDTIIETLKKNVGTLSVFQV